MSQQEQIMDLKRRALALKQAGDVEGAMALLVQAREVEYENASIDDYSDPVQLRQFAVVLKNKGDLDGARAALIKAMEIQKQQEEMQGEASDAADFKQEEVVSSRETNNTNGFTGSNGIAKQEDATPIMDDTTADDEDDADLAELMMMQQQDDASGGGEGGPVTFSEEEMLDQEMMTEFKASGIAVPSDEDYQAKILSSKKAALAYKNAGDIANATAELRKSKQLEAVRVALSQISGGDDEFGWMAKELNGDSNDDAMLGSLMQEGSAMRLDLDDLQDMDAEMLKDAIDMGMEIPNPQDVLAQANDKKMQAVNHKKLGDMGLAMAALQDSKKLQAQATQLEQMLKEVETRKNSSGGGEVPMEDLEALLAGETTPAKAAPPKPATPAKPPQPQAPVKSSEELKQEAVRLRNANNMAEATRVFKLYKEALQREASANEANRCREMMEQLQSEQTLATKQFRLLKYYKRFVDKEEGQSQEEKWNAYAKKCAQVQKLIKVKGSHSVTMTKTAAGGMTRLVADEQEMVRGISEIVDRGTEPTDDRLEVCILDVQGIQDNKTLKKILKENNSARYTLRVNVTIQLPPTLTSRDDNNNNDDSEKSIDLVFEHEPVEDNKKDVVYEFGEVSQYVQLPVRGDSRPAKSMLRRMERRKMLVQIYHVPYVEKKRGGWFSRRRDDDADLPQPTLLGKVVLELKDFLTQNTIAGDFPLVGAGSKVVGGTVGLAVRTGVPYDLEKQQEAHGGDLLTTTNIIVPHKALSFALAKTQQQQEQKEEEQPKSS